MAIFNTSTLAEALQSVMEAGYAEFAADLAKIMVEHGIEITLDDCGGQDDEDLDDGLVSSQTVYRLMVGDDVVATLARAGITDTATGRTDRCQSDCLPSRAWKAVIEAAGIDDDSWDEIPGV